MKAKLEFPTVIKLNRTHLEDYNKEVLFSLTFAEITEIYKEMEKHWSELEINNTIVDFYDTYFSIRENN